MTRARVLRRVRSALHNARRIVRNTLVTYSVQVNEKPTPRWAPGAALQTAYQIASREFAQQVDLTMSAGLNFRGSPDGYNLTKGFIWGIGMEPRHKKTS